MVILRGGCVVCGAGSGALCARCWGQVEPPPTTTVRGVGRVTALFSYGGHGARIVQELKYRDGRRLVSPLADALADALVADMVHRADIVTWIPTSGARRRDRGFDQAELLARAVARRLDVPCRGLLRRRPGRPQTALDRADREEAARRRLEVTGRGAVGHVALIDDVCTTGASLRAASAALRRRTPVSVRAAVVARTP